MLESPKPTPQENHRRDMQRQIWLPLVLALLLVIAILALTILAAIRGEGTVSKGSSVSVIYLVIGWMFAGLVNLALLVVSIRLVAKMYRGLPALGQKARGAVEHVNTFAHKAADSAVRPVMQAEGLAASARALWQALKKRAS